MINWLTFLERILHFLAGRLDDQATSHEDFAQEHDIEERTLRQDADAHAAASKDHREARDHAKRLAMGLRQFARNSGVDPGIASQR